MTNTTTDTFESIGDAMERVVRKVCSISGCEKKSRKLGMCDMHYWRVKRHGIAGTSASTRAAVGEPLAWLLAHVGYDKPGCLIWPFARADNGRGTLHPDGESTTEYAHRRMCSEAHGAPPSDGLDAAHNCGQGHEGCVHPKHLRWDTRAGNVADRLKHGTDQLGENNHQAKLTDLAVREIRREAAAGVRPCDIAARHGVAPNTVSNIKNHKSWRHVS